MIGTNDISLIVYDQCEALGLRCILQPIMPEEEISDERIVIICKQVQRGDIWRKAFVEINICVPDCDGEADLVRLQQLERLALGILGEDLVGEYDGTTWQLSLESYNGAVADKAMKAHYINIRLLFQILNTY